MHRVVLSSRQHVELVEDSVICTTVDGPSLSDKWSLQYANSIISGLQRLLSHAERAQASERCKASETCGPHAWAVVNESIVYFLPSGFEGKVEWSLEHLRGNIRRLQYLVLAIERTPKKSNANIPPQWSNSVWRAIHQEAFRNAGKNI